MNTIRFSPHSGNSEIFESLIGCYHDVFADPPWNEWYRCPTCNKFWGRKDFEELDESGFRHCGTKLVEFWPHETIRNDILHEVTDETSCWLAVESDRVIGFSWGYAISVDKLEAKLGLSFAHELAQLGHKNGHRIAYHDEIGVLERHRGQGIAKELFIKNHSDHADNGLEIVVARTRELLEPSVSHTWFVDKKKYRVVARYPKEDGRAVLAQKIVHVL